MDKELLLKVLQFDSIVHLLTWTDRVRIHLYMNAKPVELTSNITSLGEVIKKLKWEAPNMKYGDDRLLYYEHQRYGWRPIEELEKILKQII